MKGKSLFKLLALGLVLALGVLFIGLPALVGAQGPEPQDALGTAFTYQGYLEDGGSPADGSYDFQFKLYDAASNGNQVGSTVIHEDITVTDGSFTVDVDFGGSAFTGDARWLEIGVRPGSSSGSDPYTTLSPRQALTPTPYALYAASVPDHDHLGQTWTGSSNPLVITGTFSTPNYSAPLVLGNSHPSGTGLRVSSAGGKGVSVDSAGSIGVHVSSAGHTGVHVYRAGNPSTTIPCSYRDGFQVNGAEGNGLCVGQADIRGVAVASASGDGVYVYQAGNPSTTSVSDDHNGFEVAGAGGNGLYVGQADEDGVVVASAGSPSTTSPSTYKNGLEVAGAEGHGLYVGRADFTGVRVGSAGSNGVHVDSAGADGVHVFSAVYEGLEVDYAGAVGVRVSSAGHDGVYVGSAGDDGVHVGWADGNGVYGNTTASNGEWGFYTPDKIYAGTTLVSGGPLMFVAQNGDAGELELGDVVAAVGLGAPFADSPSFVTLVRRADPASGAAVVGVVYSHFVAEEEVEEIEGEGGVERYTRFETHSTEGAIAPGEYLLMVVLGTCEVKVDATAGAISPGDSLALSSAQGRAARAQPLTLDGVSFYPSGVTFGTALASLEEGTGTIPAFVTLH